MQIDDEQFAWRLLETLYDLACADIDATPAVVATWVDAQENDVQHMLRRLDGQGLVDSERCRLSMQGLVLAVSFHGARKLARQRPAA